ncbi:MAG: glycine--tRNA ligase subunit beta [Gammaproteobacteria bacterium]|nr:glycine--tRNA ligase subunit beta [Gammaproteobacteria bacterium]
MMKTSDLLIEIGTEELPPKALKKLSVAFSDGIRNGLESAELEFETTTAYASPRRLAVLVKGCQKKQSNKIIEKRGPSLKAAYDDEGNPTQAATGFAKSCGVEVAELDKLETDKGTWLSYNSEQRGKTAQSIIPAIVQKSLDDLPIPKRMRWGNLKEQFVRPVHWVILLFGDQVINAKILGIKAGRETVGHRFHHPDTIYIDAPENYASLLETKGNVIVDFESRRNLILTQILKVAKIKGTAIIDGSLLDEVTGMVEWPQAIIGNFDERFLDVPSEALISAMKSHQKYFHVVDDNKKLMPHFITISNIKSKKPAMVRVGNERVIRPRLADSEFFWKQDQKQPLFSHNKTLNNVVFQSKLGSLHDKVLRTSELAGHIAEITGLDVEKTKRAAMLCKCDLMTNMVSEFPDLQGTMGRYYAELDGEDKEVALAIEEHYMPRFSGDKLPSTDAGKCLALADKIDSMVGLFGVGLPPTGDKDPFALRRAALGVVRILIEENLDIDLNIIIKKAIKNYTYQKLALAVNEATTSVYNFILTRLQVYYVNKGFARDEIDAVLSLKPSQLNDCENRLRALSEFRKLPEATSLAAANKRISNIIKKSKDKIPEKCNPFILVGKDEKMLATVMGDMINELEPLFDNRDYEAAMKKLAGLRKYVDAFFDNVMVMTKEDTLRINRLALLNSIRNQFLKVADISKLQ